MSGLDENELRAFEDSVASFVTDAAAGKQSTRDLWRSIAELGWSSVAISEAMGGLESGTSAITIVARYLAEALWTTPFLSTGVVASILLDRLQDTGENSAHIAGLLERVVSGDVVFGVAVEELFGDRAFVQLALGGAADKPVLNGCSSFVCDAGVADYFLVPATTSDGNIELCLVPADAKGVTIASETRSMDRRDVRTVTFHNCTDCCTLGSAHSAIEDAGIAIRLALSAEAIGIMVALNKLTCEYLKVRRQFGMPLASFQVLQHRIVDMAIDEQQSVALVQRACGIVDDGAADAKRMALIARSFTAQAVRRVAEAAVQLHGGIGMTEELIVGQYLKRALAISSALGGPDEDLRQLSELPQRPWYGESAPLERAPVPSN